MLKIEINGDSIYSDESFEDFYQGMWGALGNHVAFAGYATPKCDTRKFISTESCSSMIVTEIPIDHDGPKPINIKAIIQKSEAKEISDQVQKAVEESWEDFLKHWNERGDGFAI